jgi:poly-gamma-glutamate capsule biosynthesis protein CapA/YwtB (metallophosphatase superfamily)
MKININLLFSGDLAPLINYDAYQNNHFDDSLCELFSQVDAHIGNLECPLTIHETAINKTGPILKAKPKTIMLLKQASISIACLANNHIYDFGERGISDTLEVCRKNGIDTVGIVNRLDGQSHWLIKKIRSIKVGFLNYCEHEFSVRERGLLGACGYSPIDAYYDIYKLKQNVDYLIVIYHGGNEYYQLPNPDMKKNFHYMADLGADAVISHHSHVYSGYEIYNGKPLVYGLGNFFFPYPDEPEEWHQGLICKLIIMNNTIGLKFYPIIQCYGNQKVEYPIAEETHTVMQNIKYLSNIISDDEKLSQHWKEYVEKSGKGLTSLLLYSNKYERRLVKSRIIGKYLKNNNRAKIIYNILRCSSLKKLVIDNLGE